MAPIDDYKPTELVKSGTIRKISNSWCSRLLPSYFAEASSLNASFSCFDFSQHALSVLHFQSLSTGFRYYGASSEGPIVLNIMRK